MYDVIIIGAGPAGLMAAIEASKTHKVLVIERNEIAGKKLQLTGGGRCNLTNLKNNRDFLDEVAHNKKYLYSAINKFGPEDIYNFFTSRGVLLKEEKENQIFPVSNKASDILNVLLKESAQATFHYDETVVSIEINGTSKRVITDRDIYDTRNIIVATGGISFKNTGSCGDHMEFAKVLNQPTVNLYPAEVGIVLKEQLELAGTTIENVRIYYKNYKTEGNLIYTHRGLSGTSIMKMSEHIYNNLEKEIIIDLLPAMTEEELIKYIENFDKEKEVITFFNSLFTKRFSNYLIQKDEKLNFPPKMKGLNNSHKRGMVKLVKDCKYIVKEVSPIDNAYVTGGGISLTEIDSTSMESKINKGIYFIGESLDIHGPIGGYNITLALSTGYLAGNSININKNTLIL